MNYVAPTPATANAAAVSGSIAITVSGSNFDQANLKGANLTFVLDSKTKVVLHNDLAIASGDRVIVQLRAPLGTKLVTAEAATPPVSFTALHVVDQGAQS